ncbi:MAG TPA: hypothetical protein VFO86_15600, partial [Terriglobia bacterium]|nr:hypothetical protein [Terriglobia bacterium]
SFSQVSSSAWFAEKTWIGLLSASALVSFLFAWMYVSRQRSGSGQSRNWISLPIDRIADGLPGRRSEFASPVSAQCWMEWRRTGLLLPLIVGVILLLVIGPLALYLAKDADSSLDILFAVLVMPAAIALPIGKGFSKPDIWSNDLSLPAFTAVRPLTTDEMVAIKMKVAVRSTLVSWLLVLSFLVLWLPFGANFDLMKPVQAVLWQVSGQNSFLQFAIAALVVLVGMLLTWRFLVGGLWIGLSGNNKLYVVSAIPYAFLPIVGMASLILFQQRAQEWIQHNLDRLLPTMEWIALLAVIAKLSLAVFSWRNIAPQQRKRYLAIWIGSTLCLVALTMFVWTSLQHVLPSEVYPLRNLMILCALLTIPLARPGLATRTLAKNRHR